MKTLNIGRRIEKMLAGRNLDITDLSLFNPTTKEKGPS
jgi:hypothetical protein